MRRDDLRLILTLVAILAVLYLGIAKTVYQVRHPQENGTCLLRNPVDVLTFK